MQTQISHKVPSLKIMFTIIIPFTCGYFLTAFFNQVNAVIAPYIMADIGLTSNTLGFMTSIYLLCFAFFQLPLGLLLDHYGPRRVQLCLFMVAAIGILTFATAHSVWQLTLGRAIIGLGLAAGLMAGFKAIRDWYPKEKIPLMNSIMMSCGTLGALFSTSPTEYILMLMSWQKLLMLIAILTVAVGFLIFVVAKDSATASVDMSLKQQIRSLGVVYKSKYFWKIAPLAASCFAINMSMVGLWSGIWFTKVAKFTSLESAHHLFAISVALILGIIFNGFIANKVMTVLKLPITVVISVGLILFIIIQLVIVLGPYPGSYLLWFLFGLLGRSVTLSYAALSQYFPAHYAGKAITAVNLIMFLTAFLMQYIIGLTVHLLLMINSVSTSIAYKTTFLLMIIIQLFTFIWFVYQRERHSSE
jgi:MFS family permease